MCLVRTRQALVLKRIILTQVQVAVIFQLAFWKTCLKYISLKVQQYENPDVNTMIQLYGKMFEGLRLKTGFNFITPAQVWYLDNLFEAFVRKVYQVYT